MEATLWAWTQYSLQNHLHENAVFLAERLVAEALRTHRQQQSSTNRNANNDEMSTAASKLTRINLSLARPR